MTHFCNKGLNDITPLSANPTKWLNTLKQFVGSILTNCLSVFDHFVKLVHKELKTHIVLYVYQETRHTPF